ncbi:MAG TPA: cupredoxin domain-containing protein [Candidatus Nanoarchaeia archaeon]|nr:cupredoxin domain-containing protein [Candidatus Nanoarchaeia archaeon]
MKANNIAICVAIGIVLVLAVFSIKTLLMDNSVPKQSVTLVKSVAEAELVNGVQIVNLSWGKFNYAPDTIRLKQKIPVKIVADTTRLTGCFRSLEIPDMGVSEQITDEDNIIEFTPEKKGTFRFSCAMGMGSGTIEVT